MLDIFGAYAVKLRAYVALASFPQERAWERG